MCFTRYCAGCVWEAAPYETENLYLTTVGIGILDDPGVAMTLPYGLFLTEILFLNIMKEKLQEELAL